MNSARMPGPDADIVDHDAHALVRLAAGELGALGELYDRHAVSLLRFACRSSSREDGEDATQAVFLRLAVTAIRFDPSRASGVAWIYGVAAHVLSERRRAWARLAKALSRMMHEQTISQVRAQATSTTASVEVGRALDSLSRAMRMTFVLVELEGFTCEEAAEMLQVPVGTIWTRLHYARRRLRALLDREVGP